MEGDASVSRVRRDAAERVRDAPTPHLATPRRRKSVPPAARSDAESAGGSAAQWADGREGRAGSPRPSVSSSGHDTPITSRVTPRVT
jgi:hypothetical protein